MPCAGAAAPQARSDRTLYRQKSAAAVCAAAKKEAPLSESFPDHTECSDNPVLVHLGRAYPNPRPAPTRCRGQPTRRRLPCGAGPGGRAPPKTERRPWFAGKIWYILEKGEKND
nr:MAG TPA: hypothetical protein [Caudoviricetes sp.]